VFERFTSQARAVVVRAEEESRRLQHRQVGTEHLLLGLLGPDAGPAGSLLRDAGLDLDRVRDEVARRVTTPPPLLRDEDVAALRTVGIDVDAVLDRMQAAFGPEAVQAPDPLGRRRGLRRGAGRSRFTARARKVLELSLREAIRLRDGSIGSEHLLLGLLRDGRGTAVDVLTDAGVDLDRLRRQAEVRRGAA
jgi:ATP-dependent Clp protease ATP-binding subunit ClpA